MKHYITILVIALLSFNLGFGQEMDNATKNKIRVKFITAEEHYSNRDYKNTLVKMEEVERLLGDVTLPTALNLKIKALVGLKRFIEAKKAVSSLENMELDDAILQDMAIYSTTIDEGVEREKIRIAKDEEIQRKKDEAEAIANENKKKRKLNIEKAIEQRLLELKNEQYDWYEHNNLAIVSFLDRSDYEEKQGIINKSGTIKVPLEFTEIVLTKHMAYGMKEDPIGSDYDEEYVIINPRSGYINRGKYKYLTTFGEKIVIVEDENIMKIINMQSNSVIYRAQKTSSNRYAPGVSINNRFKRLRIKVPYKNNNYRTTAIVDENGKFLVRPGTYDDIKYFQRKEARAIVKKNGYYGLIDTDGKKIAAVKYVDMRSFVHGRAMVKNRSGKYGFINKNGVEVIPTIYTSASSFYKGSAFVKMGRRKMRVDVNGNKVR